MDHFRSVLAHCRSFQVVSGRLLLFVGRLRSFLGRFLLVVSCFRSFQVLPRFNKYHNGRGFCKVQGICYFQPFEFQFNLWLRYLNGLRILTNIIVTAGNGKYRAG